ncbi:ABC transporter ATP-binding protein [Salidesulfovibrio brasiliensis]|uniref:ABC transporter ATP-binding protein n=1 Tax=Salidesulfovibrio brasiliensis TaxID=221711 RepID=UPI0006D2A98D|nr:ABC transporter ATP-binding protein [Salidesulfovibrio brasiliensis]
MSSAVYSLQGVSKEFEGPAGTVHVLRNINLTVDAGSCVAVVGASGSGKTSLLHIMGTLDNASGGSVLLDGVDLETLDNTRRARLRNRDIGFIFQFHHLLPEFSTLENVAMPGIIAGRARSESLALADEALNDVGLEHRKSHKVTTLSGGERQRAAIARAILMRPKVVLADEPTGSLDEESGRMVGELLVSLARNHGTTLVVVTHNRDLAGLMHQRHELRSGELYAC